MLIALIVAGAFFMENLDGTVIATALPQMAHSFGVNPIVLSIGMTAYLLTLAVFIPISGWIADRYGARTVFGSAIAVFTVSSLLCGISNGLWTFTGARILQGIGGAMMVPVGRLVVLRGTEKADLLRALAYVTWPGLIAPVLGPPVGGFFTTYASWRWIFFLNLPLGLVALILTWVFIANDRMDKRAPFDALGFVLTGVGLAALMYGFELLGRTDTPWLQALGFVAVGLVVGATAIWHARRTAHPLIDLSALTIPTFAVAIWGGSLFRIAIGTVPFLVPLLLQIGFGLNAFSSGLLVLALFAGNLGIKPLTTPILRWFGFRAVLIANGLLNAVSILACALLSANTPVAIIAAVLFAGGVCRSLQFTCIASLSFSDIPPVQMSGASTFSSTVQQLTMGMGIAVGAMALHFAMLLRGGMSGTPTVMDFRLAFVLIALIAGFGIYDCFALDRRAGAQVSGHQKVA
jgi:EmrB/QacA subfamily drug resistance transporter